MEGTFKNIKLRLENNSFLNEKTGCLLWTGKNTGNYGRMSVKWPDEPKAKDEYTHRLAMMVHLHCKMPKSDQISHLCHQHACFNISCLRIESLSQNCQRNKCLASEICKGHTDYDGTELEKCIK